MAIDGSTRCGTQPPETDSVWDLVSLVVSIVGGGYTAYTIAEWLQATATPPPGNTTPSMLSLFGVNAPTALWAGTGLAAVAVIGITGVFWYQRCASEEGRGVCGAGVVNEIEESFSSGWDYVFPFAAQHTRIDLVLRARDWPLAEPPRADYVKCTTVNQIFGEPSVTHSPILQCFDDSGEVCSAAAGAFVGALIGAAVGIPLGVAAAAAIACAATFFFACLLVAVVIAVVATLAGAAIGGNLGRQSSVRYSDGSRVIQVGDYASVKGNLVVSNEHQGAAVLWWLTECDVHSQSSYPGPPFPYWDPENNLTLDSCTPD